MASTGFIDGSAYDKGRPSYTEEAVEYIINLLKKTSDKDEVKYDVLELGAGTGKFTQVFLNKMDKGTRYFATEPSEGFLASLKNNCPSAEVRQCTAASIPLPDNSVRLVVAAQCFHWFANETNIREIHRVLIPGGIFAMIWNHKDSRIPWVKQMQDIVKSHYTEDTPYALSYKWKPQMENFSAFEFGANPFLSGIDFKGPKDFIVESFCTISVMSSLDPEQKKIAAKKLRNILDSDEATKNSQEIKLPFTTEIYYSVKR